MGIILDTCAFIWLTSDPEKLSEKAKEEIVKNRNSIFISDASCLEICLKYYKNKIVLPNTPRAWYEEQKSIWKIEELSLSRDVIYRLTEMPHHHGDPFDLLLVASALENRFAIITPDAEIAKYPIEVIW